MKKIYITMGDPRGAGPELIFGSLKDISDKGGCNFIPVVIGDAGILGSFSSRYGLDIDEFAAGSSVPGGVYFVPVAGSGHPGRDSLNYIDAAVRLVREDAGSALVTAPVEKNIVAQAKKGFAGHTEYLAGLFGASCTAMTFVTRSIKMSMLTTHIPLKKVPAAISIGKLSSHAALVDSGLRSMFRLSRPKIVLCGLNPHAGDRGLVGREEDRVLRPGVDKIRASGIDIAGPLSAEEALRRTVAGEYDFVISLYHDQLLPGVKAMLGPAVNLTMGLPVVRTSPDHGPCIDISGKGLADSSSMEYAIRLAEELVPAGG
ncbi:MAG: 4-hydroxythreonine-4-phosphate dehydrogenase PdxA [Elusimicrobia bacterium]|nr:4-hydroxythreonine-4-phosphate dehydrogenase PdxA [Elusimicrobiota bacterium]